MQVNLNIQEQENLYYFYHNWQAGKENKIHKGSCGFCNYGTGMHKSENRGKSGVWIGPFSNVELCNTYIEQKLKIEEPVELCNYCN